ncbi:helix-turn-helix transcriptional regulator [Demequina salsinemoris]|uniref:helix-turn-helix transcriptional regulator n=1 Tax=Demequina salsinemoris TaxID=577470 RepID=UPI000783112C|nr:WYL domain-containing protein [Demequina salsinemoris]
MADATARLLNLIVALTDTRRTMSREAIRATVEGYTPVPKGASEDELKRSDDAFERMFERDKDDLRRLGIPLLTVEDAHANVLGYRIDSADAAFPVLDLTAAEIAVLSVASAYWEDATLGDDARQALTKVSSGTGAGAGERVLSAGRSRAAGAAVGVLLDAIEQRRAVRFDYSSSTSGLQGRSVQPWRLLARGGALYLQGLDTVREGPRTFRLSRIQGDVKATGPQQSYEIPTERPEAFSPQQGGTAVVAARPETAHALRVRGTPIGQDGDWDLIRVDYRHADALREEILALSGAARIVEPTELAEQVVAHARAALEVSRG